MLRRGRSRPRLMPAPRRNNSVTLRRMAASRLPASAHLQATPGVMATWLASPGRVIDPPASPGANQKISCRHDTVGAHGSIAVEVEVSRRRAEDFCARGGDAPCDGNRKVVVFFPMRGGLYCAAARSSLSAPRAERVIRRTAALIAPLRSAERNDRKRSDLPDGLASRKPVQPLLQKYSGFPKTQITLYPSPSRPDQSNYAGK
jgi:hypothetical protein